MDRIISQATHQTPAAHRRYDGGGARRKRHYGKKQENEKDAMARQTIVESLPRTISMVGVGETKEDELKETQALTRGKSCQKPPVDYRLDGGGK